MVLVIVGCKTMEGPRQSVPRQYEDWFANCDVKSNERSLSAAKKGQLVFQGSVDWVEKPSGLRLEVSDPFGSVHFWFENRTNTKISYGGGVARRMSKLVAGENGLMYYGSYPLLRADEIGCLLKGRLPIAWKDKLKGHEGRFGFTRDDQEVGVQFTEGQRVVVILSKPHWWQFRPDCEISFEEASTEISVPYGDVKVVLE